MLFNKSNEAAVMQPLTTTTPILLFKPEVLVKMETYVQGSSSDEIGWLGIVDDLGSHKYLCSQVYAPLQEVHGATTEITAEGLVDLAERLVPSQVESLRLWGHSHVNMGVSPSSQDREQMSLFISNGMPWFFRIICNKKGDMGVTFFDYENGYYITACPWDVYNPVDTSEIVAEAETEMKENVRQFAKQYVGNGWGVANGVYTKRPTPSPIPRIRDTAEQFDLAAGRVFTLLGGFGADSTRVELPIELAIEIYDELINLSPWEKYTFLNGDSGALTDAVAVALNNFSEALSKVDPKSIGEGMKIAVDGMSTVWDLAIEELGLLEELADFAVQEDIATAAMLSRKGRGRFGF